MDIKKNIYINFFSDETCFYCAQWVWPELSNEIFFEVSVKERTLKGPDEKVWNAIGFSNGTKMVFIYRGLCSMGDLISWSGVSSC